MQIQLQTFDEIDDDEIFQPNDIIPTKIPIMKETEFQNTEFVINQLEVLKNQPPPPEPKMDVKKSPFSLALGGGSSDKNVPSLDFSRLKHVRENDWYAYSKKLEEIIEGLRIQIEQLQNQIEVKAESLNIAEKGIKELTKQIKEQKEAG